MLTNHQKEKLAECINILQTSDRLLIKGSAGVGKTFMVNELLNVFQSTIRGFIYCSAPTNKAVSVLKSKIPHVEKGTYFITTHAALKLKRIINNETGETYFKPVFKEPYVPLKNVKLLIIDETSMISSELLSYIEEYATMQNCKVIFLGDNKQLNPVNEEESPVFLGKPFPINETLNNDLKSKYKGQKKIKVEGITYCLINDDYIKYTPYPEVCLTEIVRQKDGNPIIDLSNNINLLKRKVDNRIKEEGYIFSNDFERVLTTLAEVNGTDKLKYLAYTNAEVNKVNKLVREKIYGNPSKIELGETLIFDEPYKDYYTNEEVLVKNVKVIEKEFFVPIDNYADTEKDKVLPVTLKYYSINYSEIDGKIVDDIIVIHEDSEKDLKDCLIRMKKEIKISNIKWVDYYQFLENFAKLKYNHAITVHKSQGSTYKQVIINVRNLYLCRNFSERKRLLYTAITRASDLLILYNI